MYRCLAIFAVVWCLAILGCSRQPEFEWESAEDRLPQGWNPNELADAAMEGWEELGVGRKRAEARILIWKIMEDERAGTIEQAIVWLGFENDECWILANVFRHPGTRPPKWELTVISPHSGQPPRRAFDHAPDNDEIYEFLRATWWTFAPLHGWRLVDASVCADAWKAVTGQEPAKPYTKMLKK